MARPTKVATIVQTRRHDQADNDAREERIDPSQIREKRNVVLHRERERDAGQRPVADRHQRQPEEREIDEADQDEAGPLRQRAPSLTSSASRPRRRGIGWNAEPVDQRHR